jgi:hypothetical protein
MKTPFSRTFTDIILDDWRSLDTIPLSLNELTDPTIVGENFVYHLYRAAGVNPNSLKYRHDISWKRRRSRVAKWLNHVSAVAKTTADGITIYHLENQMPTDNNLPEIDPAVFETPSTAETNQISARRVANIWRAKCGDAPFTVVTLIALARHDEELRSALLPIAPDRFGLGSLSQNMLTRWFKAQEGRSIPGAGVHLQVIGSGIWQYANEEAEAAA